MSNPICVRCARRLAVACVRHPIGHKDAVCVSCATITDTMLPLYWPGYTPSVESIRSSVLAFHAAGNDEGAVVVLIANASLLGLDASELHRMAATDAVILGLRTLVVNT